MSTFTLWLKDNKIWILILGAIFLLMSSSFAAGYLSAQQDNPAPIIIEKCSKN